MRARVPGVSGFAESHGVRIFYEVFGEGEPTILFPPTWEIVHSRCWKAQIPYCSRHFRVVTFDPPGNGRSDRPVDPAAYGRRALADDAIAVMDAAGVARAVVVAWCDMGESLILAADHPDRIAGLVLIAPPLPVAERPPAPYSFTDVLDNDEGWAKENRQYWLRDWRGYAEFFFSQCFTEPHSTKQLEDAVGWSLETDAETMLVGFDGWETKELDPATTVGLCSRIKCPGLVIHGADDILVPWSRGSALAEKLHYPMVLLDGSGHGPHARDPVKINLLIREFVESAALRETAGHR